MTAYAKKPQLKLENPPEFTGRKDGMPVEEWLVKMKGKMEIDDDIINTPWRCMAYVMSRVGGIAFSHLEPRAQKNGPARPWKDLDEMLAYLECVFGDSNRRENAEYEFRILRQTGDFNIFWAEFLWLSIELDRNKSTLISNLTDKLSLDMQFHLINGDKQPTDLLKYAKRCQHVYQKLKDLARAEAEAFEESMEECVVAKTLPIQKINISTIRTAKSSRHPVTTKRDRLMKKGRCFSCKEVGHQTMICPNKQKPTSELAVSPMTIQESKPCGKAFRAELPRVEKPLAEEPLIVSASSLPGNFFAEEALVTLCILGNNNKIETTALLDTRATGYSFVDLSMAQRICDDLLIEPIRLSKPKVI